MNDSTIYADWLLLSSDERSALWALREQDTYTIEEATAALPNTTIAKGMLDLIIWSETVYLTLYALALVAAAVDAGWSPVEDTLTWDDLGTHERQTILLLAEPVPGVHPRPDSVCRLERLGLIAFYDNEYHLTPSGDALYLAYHNPEHEMKHLYEENALLRSRLAAAERSVRHWKSQALGEDQHGD